MAGHVVTVFRLVSAPRFASSSAPGLLGMGTAPITGANLWGNASEADDKRRWASTGDQTLPRSRGTCQSERQMRCRQEVVFWLVSGRNEPRETSDSERTAFVSREAVLSQNDLAKVTMSWAG